MVRIVGVDIPDNKRVEIALTYIRGIGRSLANKILYESGISPDVKVKDLKDEEIAKLREAIEKGEYLLEGELMAEIQRNIKRLREIKSYRGMRHERNLPVRGQRTRTNARTKRGKRIAVAGTSRSALEAKKSQKT